MESHQIKNLFSVIETFTMMKRQATYWERIFANDVSGKGLSRI